MKKIILCIVLIFCLSGCNKYLPHNTQNTDSVHKDLLLTIEEQISLQEENQALTQSVNKLQSELDNLQNELDEYQNTISTLNNKLFSLTNYEYFVHDELIGVKYIDNVLEVRSLPFEESSVIGTMEKSLVTIHFTISHDDTYWSLIDVYQRGEGMNTIGWVQWDQLIEYHSNSMQTSLKYPVRIRTGVELVDEQHDQCIISNGTSNYKVEYISDDKVIVLEAGGIQYVVNREDVLYPTVIDNQIVW